jgi:sulfoxide reductase heme-binding subunit YedZ
MDWLKKHWRLLILHGIALGIVAYTFTQGRPGLYIPEAVFDPGLASGEWAIRFLLLCLAVTPLNTYLRWRWAIPLRKWLGLWAFAFAVLHLAVYLITAADAYSAVIGIRFWEYWRASLIQFYIVLGALGLLILSALALTSNKAAMRALKRNWKRLHRLVYGAGMLVVIHAMLSTTRSKKIARDPNAIDELRVYLVILVLLLALRIPAVKQVMDQPARWLRRTLAGETASN